MRVPFLFTPTQFIKGVGPLLGQRLNQLGLPRFWDVLRHVPQSYTIYTKDLIVPDRPVCLEIVCQKQLGRSPWRFLCHTCHDGQEVELVFFHAPKPPIRLNSKWLVKGVVTLSKGRYQIIHPDELKPWPHQEPCRLIVPQYSLSKGISSTQISRWVRTILDQWPAHLEGPSPFDPSWPTWKEAFLTAHFPSRTEDTLPQAIWRKRLACDEILAQHLSHLCVKEEYTSYESPPLCENEKGTDFFLKNFGHPLTPSQHAAWQAIKQDVSRCTPMMRLVHGDVGSGKTVIAFLAMIQAANAGNQACLMAPTETLIRQHYENLCRWSDVPVQLILGQGKRLGPKDAPLILGTHALFHKEELFSSLGLVVIDEQQRFGVMQRLSLINKGHSPHLLLLSATPIPRTFERLLWGQIEVSQIQKRPSHIPLRSYVISSARIPELKEWIEKCFQRQERVYWVCPAIEDETKGVLHRTAYWQQHFPQQVAPLHGQMSSHEKEHAIAEFRSGHTPLLVTTTVIEVGMHVAEASTMIIEESPRFGLSQLHQLRGRVGRDHIPGHCFFLYTPPSSPSVRARLDFMRECHNGFEIAERDWSLRGSGVLLGTQQSGFAAYHFFDIDHHSPFLESALEHAKKIKESSTELARLILDLFNYHSPEILKAG
jgi:ATP-dependent DNA helicase RecG